MFSSFPQESFSFTRALARCRREGISRKPFQRFSAVNEKDFEAKACLGSLVMLAEVICCLDERAGDAGFEGGVAGVGDDLQGCFGPGAVQVPGV